MENKHEEIKKLYEEIFAENLVQHMSNQGDQATVVSRSRDMGTDRTAWKLVETFLGAIEKFEPQAAAAFEALSPKERIDITNTLLGIAKQVVRDAGAAQASKPTANDVLPDINVMDQAKVDSLSDKLMKELEGVTDEARINQILEQLKSINRKAAAEFHDLAFNKLAEVHMSGPHRSRCVYCLPHHLKDASSNPVPGNANDAGSTYSDGLCSLWGDNEVAALAAGFGNIRNEIGAIANEKIKAIEKE